MNVQHIIPIDRVCGHPIRRSPALEVLSPVMLPEASPKGYLVVLNHEHNRESLDRCKIKRLMDCATLGRTVPDPRDRDPVLGSAGESQRITVHYGGH